jgi:hypothetical protein
MTFKGLGPLSLNFGLLSLMSQFSYPCLRGYCPGLTQPGDKRLPRLIDTLHV